MLRADEMGRCRIDRPSNDDHSQRGYASITMPDKASVHLGDDIARCYDGLEQRTGTSWRPSKAEARQRSANHGAISAAIPTYLRGLRHSCRSFFQFRPEAALRQSLAAAK